MSQHDTSYLPVKQVLSVQSVTEILMLSSVAKSLCSEVYNLCTIYLTVPMTSAGSADTEWFDAVTYSQAENGQN